MNKCEDDDIEHDFSTTRRGAILKRPQELECNFYLALPNSQDGMDRISNAIKNEAARKPRSP